MQASRSGLPKRLRKYRGALIFWNAFMNANGKSRRPGAEATAIYRSPGESNFGCDKDAMFVARNLRDATGCWARCPPPLQQREKARWWPSTFHFQSTRWWTFPALAVKAAEIIPQRHLSG